MASKSPAYPTAEPFVPPRPTLPRLRDAARSCTGCELYKRGTQTVFGEGPARAVVMFVGEQPGDQEDRTGRPFVGPAGRILDDALLQAGIARDDVYVTNVVKHFKWEPRGKRRIHTKPNSREIAACQPWLAAEVQVVKPHIMVCLGATAAQAILGKDFRLTRQRGQFVATQWAARTTATIHPSAVLRMPDDESRRAAFRSLVEDLQLVAAETRKHRT